MVNLVNFGFNQKIYVSLKTLFSIASEKLNDCLSLKSQGGEEREKKSVFVIFSVSLRNEAAAAQQTICFFEKKNERSPTRLKFF